MINLIIEQDLNDATKKGLEKLSLKNKTKTFWNKFLNEFLLHWEVLDKSLKEVDNSLHIDIILNQFSEIKKSNIELPNSYIDSFLSTWYSSEITNSFLDIFLERKDTKTVQKIIRKKSSSIFPNKLNDIISLVGINEAFKCHIVDDNLLRTHLSDFDKSLIVKYGQGKCSYDYLLEILGEDEENYVDLKDISPDRRDNVGPDCMVGYKNSGVFIEENKSNGALMYIPYGLTTYFAKALSNMNLLAIKEKDRAISDIKKIQETSESDDVKNYFISNHNYLIKDLTDISIVSKILEEALYEI